MLDKYSHIVDYFRGAWLKRKYFYVSAWLICIVGWSVITMLPNQYQSTARVYVDTDSILEPLLKGLTVEVDSDAKVQMMIKTLLSRENLDKIIRMTELDMEADTPEKYEALVKGLSNGFHIKKERRANIFTLGIKNKNPVTAKNIVESALNVFIENTIGDNRTDSTSAKRFLDQQIEFYEKQLIESENRLAEFKQKNAEILPSYSGGYYTALQNEKKLLREALLQYKILEERVNNNKKELSSYAPEMEFSSSEDERLEYLNKQLDSALLRYREIHPDIIELKSRIAKVELLKKNEIAAKRASFKKNPQMIRTPHNEAKETFSVVEQMQVTMHGLKSDLTAQAVQVNEYQDRVKDLEGKINTIPVIEAELKVLTRGYENNKSKYEDFLSRRSAALLASEVDINADKIQFNIIDPPRVPTKPAGPKHVLLTLAVLIAGLGSGGALAFLLSQIRPVATSNISVYKSSGYPIIGHVQATKSLGIREEKRKAKINFVISNIFLLGIMCCFIVYFVFPSVVISIVSIVKGLV